MPPPQTMQYCDCWHTTPRFLCTLVGSLWTLLFFSSFSFHLLFTLSCSGCLCTILPLFFQDNTCFSILVFVTFQCLYPRHPSNPPSYSLHSSAFTSSLLNICYILIPSLSVWKLCGLLSHLHFPHLFSNTSTTLHYCKSMDYEAKSSLLQCYMTMYLYPFSAVWYNLSLSVFFSYQHLSFQSPFWMQQAWYTNVQEYPLCKYPNPNQMHLFEKPATNTTTPFPKLCKCKVQMSPQGLHSTYHLSHIKWPE